MKFLWLELVLFDCATLPRLRLLTCVTLPLANYVSILDALLSLLLLRRMTAFVVRFRYVDNCTLWLVALLWAEALCAAGVDPRIRCNFYHAFPVPPFVLSPPFLLGLSFILHPLPSTPLPQRPLKSRLGGTKVRSRVPAANSNFGIFVSQKRSLVAKIQGLLLPLICLKICPFQQYRWGFQTGITCPLRIHLCYGWKVLIYCWCPYSAGRLLSDWGVCVCTMWWP